LSAVIEANSSTQQTTIIQALESAINPTDFPSKQSSYTATDIAAL